MTSAKPKQYIIQKKVMATSVAEALKKERSTPIESVFPDAVQPERVSTDAIGFKTVEVEHTYEMRRK